MYRLLNKLSEFEMKQEKKNGNLIDESFLRSGIGTGSIFPDKTLASRNSFFPSLSRRFRDAIDRGAIARDTIENVTRQPFFRNLPRARLQKGRVLG